MVGRFLRTFLYTAFLCIVCAPPAAHGAEKVKFGTRETTPNAAITPPPSREIDLPDSLNTSGNVNAALQPSLAVPPTIARPDTSTTDANQQDWIFHDTTSVEGIRRALGVEVLESGELDQTERTSTTDIEEYFARQEGATTGAELSNERLKALEELDSVLGDRESGMNLNNLGLTGLNGLAMPSTGGGSTGFRNTLNSPSPTIRTQFRELYQNQINANGPALPAIEQFQATIRSQEDRTTRTRELLNRAAMIEAMTPSIPGSVFDATSQQTAAPAVSPRENRIVTPTLEQRGGRTVIPSRPF